MDGWIDHETDLHICCETITKKPIRIQGWSTTPLPCLGKGLKGTIEVLKGCGHYHRRRCHCGHHLRGHLRGRVRRHRFVVFVD